MIMDDRTLLSDKQAVTASAPSTDVLDLGQEGVIYDGTQILKRKGVAEHIPLYIGVNSDFVSGGASTDLTIDIEEDATGAFAGAENTILSVTIPLAELLAGYIFPVDKLPRKVTKRFLRFNYTAVGGAFSGAAGASTISAGFVAAVDGMNKSGF